MGYFNTGEIGCSGWYLPRIHHLLVSGNDMSGCTCFGDVSIGYAAILALGVMYQITMGGIICIYCPKILDKVFGSGYIRSVIITIGLFVFYLFVLWWCIDPEISIGDIERRRG